MNKAPLVILCLVLAGAGLVNGQTRKEIGLTADRFSARQLNGRTIYDLVRPVLTQDDSVLSSEFGVDEGNGFVRFWGKVQIIEVEDTLQADRIRYNKDTKIGVAEGNVFMTDGVARLNAPNATHYNEEDRTEFVSGVTYSDSSGVLLAQRAVYYSEDNRATFAGEVRFTQEEVVVHADSIEYARETDISEAWGRVTIVQTTDSSATHMLTDYLYRDAKADSIQAFGRTRMASIDLVDPDTVYVSAARMKLTEKADQNSVTALDSVIVSTSSYALRGDSLVSFSKSGGRRLSHIFGSPFAWLERTQVSADSLYFLSEPEMPDSVFGYGSVFVATEDSSSGRIQQLKGRRLVAMLENDSLRTLLLEENAEALFYTRESESDPLTAVKASADGVLFHFFGGEPDEIRFYDGVKGTYYSDNLLDQVVNLAGFVWKPEKKPDRTVLSTEFWMEVEARKMSQRD